MPTYGKTWFLISGNQGNNMVTYKYLFVKEKMSKQSSGIY